MEETSKVRTRREAEGWFSRYIQGKGIDIGCGNDPLTPDCQAWDRTLGSGDAQKMAGVADETYDWVYSSHCLEHMVDPREALQNWWRILKPGGYLLVAVPSALLYEQGHWPSAFNADHKSTWEVSTPCPWSNKHYSLAEELGKLPHAQVLSVKVCDTGYDYRIWQAVETHLIIPPALADKIREKKTLEPTDFTEPLTSLGFWGVDQTSLGAEAAIEGIARKLLG